MALTYGFFDSIAGDRKYDADQMNSIFDGLISDGVIPNRGDCFKVTPVSNTLQVNVGTGNAWFNHTWTENDSPIILTLSASDKTYPRCDAIVLEINTEKSVRANSIKILRGEPYVNPARPSLINTDNVHQYPLAYITIRAGATVVQTSDIENAVGTSSTYYASNLLTVLSTQELTNDWNQNWTSFFDVIKQILSTYPATDLLYQIELKLNTSDKATSAEAVNGTNNTKWVTPLTVKAAIDQIREMVYIQNLEAYMPVRTVLKSGEYELYLN